jgi:hypothetical protein
VAGPAGFAFLAQEIEPDDYCGRTVTFRGELRTATADASLIRFGVFLNGGQIVATEISGCLLPVPEAALLRVLFGRERRGEGWQVAECSGSADMVRVVAGFDDLMRNGVSGRRKWRLRSSGAHVSPGTYWLLRSCRRGPG